MQNSEHCSLARETARWRLLPSVGTWLGHTGFGAEAPQPLCHLGQPVQTPGVDVEDVLTKDSTHSEEPSHSMETARASFSVEPTAAPAELLEGGSRQLLEPMEAFSLADAEEAYAPVPEQETEEEECAPDLGVDAGRASAGDVAEESHVSPGETSASVTSADLELVLYQPFSLRTYTYHAPVSSHDTSLIVTLVGCSHDDAARALRRHGGDLVTAAASFDMPRRAAPLNKDDPCHHSGN